MGRFAFVCLVASVLASALAARAQPRAATATATEAPPASGSPAVAGRAANDPVICRWEEELGTRLGNERVCLTKSQWQQQGYDSQDQIDDTVRRSDQVSPPGH
jgi:hypothetical protein